VGHALVYIVSNTDVASARTLSLLRDRNAMTHSMLVRDSILIVIQQTACSSEAPSVQQCEYLQLLLISLLFSKAHCVHSCSSCASCSNSAMKHAVNSTMRSC
jgi:hypothetical protein